MWGVYISCNQSLAVLIHVFSFYSASMYIFIKAVAEITNIQTHGKKETYKWYFLSNKYECEFPLLTFLETKCCNKCGHQNHWSYEYPSESLECFQRDHVWYYSLVSPPSCIKFIIFVIVHHNWNKPVHCVHKCFIHRFQNSILVPIIESRLGFKTPNIGYG